MTTNTLPDMHVLAPAIAGALGDEWSAQEDPDGRSDLTWYLIWQHEPRLQVSVDTYATGRTYGRLTIEGVLPTVPAGVRIDTTGIDKGSIHVSGASTPARIGAEIERRLLPIFREAYDQWTAKVSRARRREEHRLALAHRLAQVLGQPDPQHSTWGSDYEREKLHLRWEGCGGWVPGHGGGIARIEIDADDSGARAVMELRDLEPHQAEAVLRALAGADADHAADAGS